MLPGSYSQLKWYLRSDKNSSPPPPLLLLIAISHAETNSKMFSINKIHLCMFVFANSANIVVERTFVIKKTGLADKII